MREFTVIRSRRRTMALQVTREGQVVVRAPICAARGDIHRFVTEHEAWIAAQQARQSRAWQSIPPSPGRNRRPCGKGPDRCCRQW